MKLHHRLFLLILLFAVTTTCKKDELDPSTKLDPSTNYVTYNSNFGKIGAAGGEIKITDSSSAIYGASIIIPEGALSSNENITIVYAGKLKIDGNLINVVKYTPSGLQFMKPVKIGVPISEVSYTNVVVYYFNEDAYTFEELELVEIDKQNNIAYAYTDHFSQFFALSEEIDPSENLGIFTDPRDSLQYKYVKIGEQVWMTENLAYLPEVSPLSDSSSTEPYYYVYGYNGTDVNEAKATDNYQTYGVLYNWTAAMTACPDGWHIPTRAELTELAIYLGGTSVAGGKLKETGTAHWNSPNTGATNESGFSALPGGAITFSGIFYGVGIYGGWWSSTEYDGVFIQNGINYNRAWCRGSSSENTFFANTTGILSSGLSVRCIKASSRGNDSGNTMEFNVLLNNLNYPKALFLDSNTLYFTETGARNTIYGGKLNLNSIDLATNEKTVLKEYPQNSDALVVANNDVYLSSYHNGIPGEYGKISKFNLQTKSESHFMDIEIATQGMCLDENNNFYLIGYSRNSNAKSLYKFPASNYSNPTILHNGLGHARCIAYSNEYVYYGANDNIYRFSGSNSPSVFVNKSRITGIALSDKYLYYSSYEEGNIGRININTKEDEILFNNDEILYNNIDGPANIAFDKNNNNLYVLTHGTNKNKYKDGKLIKISNVE